MEQMSEQLHSISIENNFERVQSWYLTACTNPLWTQLIHSRYIEIHSLLVFYTYFIKYRGNVNKTVPEKVATTRTENGNK
jgi:hypothetical protein